MVKGDRRGIFFCAMVGERTYLRFVSADDSWQVVREDGSIEGEVGACLRLIECESETPIWFPDELQQRVYDFWEVAQRDIWTDWMRETDPANLQPKVRPLNLRVAEFIRANLPIDVSEDRITWALDVLESPWPRREEIMLRDWFDAEGEERTAKSRSLIEKILDTGLEPVEPPPPLPPGPGFGAMMGPRVLGRLSSIQFSL